MVSVYNLLISNNNFTYPRFVESIKNLKKSITVTNTIAMVCLAAYALTSFSRGALLKNGALNISKVVQGQYWRIVTFPFLHLNILHLAMNLDGLYSIGPRFEKRWGITGFAKIAALSVAADVLAKAIFSRNSFSVGLSGVLFGMTGSLHIIKTWNGRQVDSKSALDFLVESVVFGILMETAGLMKFDHLSHLTGYLAGLSFAWLSK